MPFIQARISSWKENKQDHVLEIYLVFQVGLGWWSVKVMPPEELLGNKVSKLESSVPIVEEWGSEDKALVTSFTNQG